MMWQPDSSNLSWAGVIFFGSIGLIAAVILLFFHSWRDKAETEVWRQITLLLADPQRVQRLVERNSKTDLVSDQLQQDLKAAEKKVSSIESARTRLARMIASTDNDDDAELLRTELSTQTKALQEIRALIEELKEKLRRSQARRLDAQRLISVCSRLGPALEKWDWEKKRKTLEVLEARVRVVDGKLVVEVPLLASREEEVMARKFDVNMKRALRSM